MEERENDDTRVRRGESEDIRDTRTDSSNDGIASGTLAENSNDASDRNLEIDDCGLSVFSKSPFSPLHDATIQQGHVNTIGPTNNSEVSKEQSPSTAGADSATTSTTHDSIQEIEKRLRALKSETEIYDEEHADANAEKKNFQSYEPVSSNKDPITSQTDNYFNITDLPLPPTTSPSNTPSLAENSTDAGHSTRSRTCSSASSVSRSYVYSSASVNSTEAIPDARSGGYGEKQILVPKYKPNGKGYCWPINLLPLGGDGRFDESIQWSTDSLIGEGASGECHRASIIPRNVSAHTFCVKKVLKYNREEVLSLYLSAKDQKEPVGADTGSENIVPFYGATYWRKEVRIFMECMEGGTVQELITNGEYNNGLSKDRWTDYITDILSALAFLHGKGIAHNDVKAANVLLDVSELQAKLADFGNASPFYDTTKAQQTRQDVWSAGCFLLEMLGQQWYDYQDRTRLPVRQFINSNVDLPTHDDKDTNDVLQLFFKNIQNDKQYNAGYIHRKVSEIIN